MRVVHWAIDGYRRVNAGDLAAALAFNAMMAIVPTILLLITVAGVLLRSDQLYRETVLTTQWLLPAGMSRDSIEAMIGARSRSGIFGVASFVGFLWVGATFFACLARTMNSVYGVENPPAVQQRVRGFVVVVVFAVLFLVTVIAAFLPSLFVGSPADELPAVLHSSLLAQGVYQVLSYGVAVLTAMILFGMLFRVVPNANQRIGDVIPGTIAIAAIFVLLVQVFPLYLRVARNLSGIGSTFAFLPLLLIWFYILAHLLLFGAFMNASYQEFRRSHLSRRQHRRASR
jgi:membrane protein